MLAKSSSSFFNLPVALDTNGSREERILGMRQDHTIHTHWKSLDDHSLSKPSLLDLFANNIPLVRERNFLSDEECNAMHEILLTHKIGIYNIDHVWPKVGCVGISQTDYTKDKDTYFGRVEKARSLQDRWKAEAGVDIMDRIAGSLRKATGLPVRLATEGDREYFAGVVRALDSGIQIHADYAPFEGANWEIGRIAAQISWNILINKIPGGDTYIYDREWRAPQDDLTFRKEFPKYAYDPQIVQGRAFKVMSARRGDLTIFNSRNFHEVRACDIPKGERDIPVRYTVSSFIGYLPGQGEDPATLVLWS
ncbi:hypothetical protein KVR01_008524 [Diaporthe batatas]|uniref:uncharacterized protein n=1 Tax=Diaporthe batatas TaxID=748121 RepID=UPI001D04FF27|nr:uncharacterized protein KVR01_008524 [Diaporthe batatas]KAG8161537.1 hypothetical protein KVR01_008524 [Diaporthe batatas]